MRSLLLHRWRKKRPNYIPIRHAYADEEDVRFQEDLDELLSNLIAMAKEVSFTKHDLTDATLRSIRGYCAVEVQDVSRRIRPP